MAKPFEAIPMPYEKLDPGNKKEAEKGKRKKKKNNEIKRENRDTSPDVDGERWVFWKFWFNCLVLLILINGLLEGTWPYVSQSPSGVRSYPREKQEHQQKPSKI